MSHEKKTRLQVIGGTISLKLFQVYGCMVYGCLAAHFRNTSAVTGVKTLVWDGTFNLETPNKRKPSNSIRLFFTVLRSLLGGSASRHPRLTTRMALASKFLESLAIVGLTEFYTATGPASV